jgi:hypothetical protein
MEKMNVPITDLVLLAGQLELLDTARYEKQVTGFADWEMENLDIGVSPKTEDGWIGREYVRHGQRVKVFEEYGAGLMFVKVRYPDGEFECCMKDWLNDPVDPNPIDPNPVDPNSVDPNPVDPNPVDPNPIDPNPVDPNPVDPNPIDPNPVDPNSIDPNHPAKGYEEIKTLKGIQYRYWRWYEDGRKRSKYLGPVNPVKSPPP